MTTTIGSMLNQVGGGVRSAIAAASQKTGIDFGYLLGQAQVESGMRPDARATTSSATGLYQFIDQSWLSAVKKYGADHGLGWAADCIGGNGAGRLCVTDPSARSAIMNLRNNPEVASLMAAETAADNKAALEARLGRPANGTDLYMAHFLGAAGGGKFLEEMADNGDQSAAALFPAAARANRNVFYDAGGRARSLGEVYQRFSDKLGRGTEIAAGGKSLPANPAMAMGMARPGAMAPASTLDALMALRATRTDGEAGPDAIAAAQMLKPSPSTARLAYMLLADLGA